MRLWVLVLLMIIMLLVAVSCANGIRCSPGIGPLYTPEEIQKDTPPAWWKPDGIKASLTCKPARKRK